MSAFPVAKHQHKMRYIYSLSLWLFQMAYVIAALDEKTLEEFFKEVNSEMAEIQGKISQAQWDFEINRTKSTEEKLVQVYKEAAETKKKYQEFSKHDWKFSDADLRRQFRKISDMGYEFLPTDDFIRIKKLELEVGSIEREAVVCDFKDRKKCDLKWKDVRDKMEKSRDPEELKFIWKEWRRTVGTRLRNLFAEYVKLSNHAATLSNFTNFEEYLLRDFKSTKVKEELTSLWEKVKPLYLELHAYVRRKLSDVYGDQFITRTGAIPTYFLGDLWTENWQGIGHLVMPYVNQERYNKTHLMITKGFNVSKIHQISEEFFSSLNFPPLPQNSWLNTSNLTDCESKVFNLGRNIRIIHCGDVSEESLLKSHSLVATAQYIQEYKQQPFIFNEFVGPGLRDAINEMVELSVSSFQHLKKINLYEGQEIYELHMNRLMEVALKKIPAIPSILAKEFWRWGVFSGEINEEDYKCKWQELSESYQGISSFTRDLNFDPGGPSDIFSSSSLVHNFIRYIGQFQIYKSLCRNSGTSSNLDDCDISGNKEAGAVLRKAMSLGSSKPLTSVLEILVGETVLNADALLEYFKPLKKWLEEENRRTGEKIGWEKGDGNACQKKHRRRRSLEYMSDSEGLEDADSFQPDLYPHLQKRSKRDNPSESQSPEKDQSSLKEETQKTALTNENKALSDEKSEKSHQKAVRRSVNYKRRRSTNHGSNDDLRSSNKFKSSWYGKNARDADGYETDEKQYNGRYVRRLLRKRGETKDDEKKENDNNSQQSKSSEENKNRSARRAYQKMRGDAAYDDSNSRFNKIRQRKNVRGEDYQSDKETKEQKLHTNTKKDISRLLHSFGFSVENDEKEKLKELKKKTDNEDEAEYEDKEKMAYGPESAVASWGNQDLKKKNYFVKKQKYDNNRFINALLNDGRNYGDNEGSSYESVIDINRLKGEDKDRLMALNDLLERAAYAKNGANKLNGNYMLQNGKVVGKKDILSAIQQAAAMKTRSDDGEGYGNVDMDLSSLQNLLKTVNLNSMAQKDNLYRSNQFFGTKGDKLKDFRLTGDDNTAAYKDRKEFREEEYGNKSPFIIIVGQITPEMKEKLLQNRGNLQPFFQSFANGEKTAQWEDAHSGKSSGKREGNEKVYIVPINAKSNHKGNKFTEHEHETGQDTERDQETEQKYHWIDNTKLNDKNSFRREKEYPSEVYVSWEGLDKNRRIARRTKREHKKFKESGSNSNVKFVPMKESMLERLLGNNLDDKNLKMLANGLANLEGNAGQSAFLSGLAAKSQGNKNAWMQGSEEMDDSKLESNNDGSLVNKELKDKDLTIDLTNPTLRCNTCGKKNKTCGDECKQECKSIFVLSCPPKCPPPCPPPCCPQPCPPPCPPPCCPTPCCPSPCPKPCPPCGPVPCPLPWPIPCPVCPSDKCDPICCEPKDVCCKKPSECSMVNAQFKITKAKKPHERLTIMIYDRINPPEELPEPYDALAVISEVLQKIQCQTCKPPCPQLTEEDPDYPANDNTDQLKGQNDASKNKNLDMNEENPNLENPEEEESDDNSRNSAEEEKSQSKDKATPALDQLTVFNKDKLAPVLLELRKIDDLIKKRNP